MQKKKKIKVSLNLTIMHKMDSMDQFHIEPPYDGIGAVGNYQDVSWSRVSVSLRFILMRSMVKLAQPLSS